MREGSEWNTAHIYRLLNNWIYVGEISLKDFFPVERNRLIRRLVDKVEIRETGIDMELHTNGLTTLIAELADLACEVTEERTSR